MINEIEKIRLNENKYKIAHFTILVVGKRNVGKNDLIKYMLNLTVKELKAIPKNNFRLFQNPKKPYLRLIKYKGMGYGEQNSAEIITKQTIDYINQQKEKSNYNNFIHCIWYCIKGEVMEELEKNYYEQLQKAYSEINIPIILIYLNEYSKSKFKKMNEQIKKDKKLGPNTDFISVMAKDIKVPIGENEIKIYKAEGEENLLNLTWDKCRTALQGDMPKIMMKAISNDVKETAKNKIKENKYEIMKLIKNNFVENFKIVLKGNELFDYILTLLGRNLKIFYDKEITNKSLNLIFKSKNIQNVRLFLETCKYRINDIIADEIIMKSIKFIEKQVELEKSFNKNIIIENKRNLENFKSTSEVFLKRNFYYISQKFIIYNFILHYCGQYLDEFQKKIE